MPSVTPSPWRPRSVHGGTCRGASSPSAPALAASPEPPAARVTPVLRAGSRELPRVPIGARMAPYRIRPYREEDYEAVRCLFAQGILEHAPAGYRHVVRSARAQLGLLVLFAAARAAAGSWLLGLAAAALALVAAWPLVRSFSTSYVRQALSTDLRDIGASYLRPPDAAFWVAEAGGAVVGMVAAAAPQDPAERGSALELKRMSVSRDFRGRGVARALCGEVLRFARARGYGAVVLSTSMVQVAAQRLYESQGFRKVGTFSPSPLGALLCFHIYHYRCDLPARADTPPR
ncbi:putative N-acetyltransferase 8B isoform X2 [Cuculus canorus]|uniref:putative N-acetyltransferase 8B isoform X2 n=1 Tax=Cuculus canorus TaxID=55661 RepID=UPI0023AA383F|nr:putative N-acetyltransferase 8B isoform X2 [Cuculus canorus]